MSDHNSAPVAPKSISRRWVFWVTSGLWLFAAWQLMFLPPMTSTFKSLGVESPDWSHWMSAVPFWAPLVFGIPMTLIVVKLSSRKLRVGAIALALIAALSAHWANAAMNFKLHQVVHHR